MKKSQAAMEFLMTYGWAILVVLVAIAALAYFGVLSPEKFLPDRPISDVKCEVEWKTLEEYGYSCEVLREAIDIDVPLYTRKEREFQTCTNSTSGVVKKRWISNIRKYEEFVKFLYRDQCLANLDKVKFRVR